jgi:excisionase family DNA binding protein
MAKRNYLNSIEAANLLGINVSTIKRWTDSGKLNCIKSAGGHRKFLMKHINEYLRNQTEQAKMITVIPYGTSEHRQLNHLIQKKDYQELCPYLLRNALNADIKLTKMIITGLVLAQSPIHKIFDELITPVLHEIGWLWEQNSISVTEEHIASQLIKDSLIQIREVIDIEATTSKKAMCLALDEELHDIALKMVQILLELRGYTVFNSGQNTPLAGIEKMVNTINPERIYISLTFYDKQADDDQNIQINQELYAIYDLAIRNGSKVYVGGQAFDHFNYDHDAVERRLMTFNDVYNY